MKAVLFPSPGQVEIVENDIPEVTSGEVLVKINYIGICGTDLSTFRGANPLVQYPVIPGHEISAEVVAKGDQVPEYIKKGMLVTANPYTNCGQCPSCKRRRYNACQYNETMGVQRNGAMQQYLALPWQKLLMNEQLSREQLALVEPLSVGFHAVQRGGVTDIDTVLVIGCGMIGAGAIIRASLRGARVIAVDLDDHKLTIARKLGAQYTVNAGKDELHDALQKITAAQGPDVVIEAVGSPATYVTAIEEVAFTGRVVYIGYSKNEVAFTTKLFVQKELDIRGSRNALPEDFRAVMNYMETGKLPLEDLITQKLKPEEVRGAMQQWSDKPEAVFKLFVDFSAD
ncbi:2-desacetyl-2-hydroxyethyl bacteriochlorophyllide A dehydrogenase [Arachidicoccus rhizosphaerae]|uniref:2-desacetyl-2-hydroxyethyl bacteriochlorophyllide A dehydrogenase n=1 Tax=Arachidicoccus rhizosphaerae TaxID=551991 RepID=A0A1H4BN26_9BACT|nr:zinc-binding alcohol dehydrogenase family protein [Arachidicoccus rhizosphaerae]SEA49487.1 2-desacetyl-2-hydroxyethyl bacteriochlorophyllide A dehydrogenase [Arachidicoccus rhizosphaerae]